MNRRDLLKQMPRYSEADNSKINTDTCSTESLPLSDLHEGDKVRITLDALVGDVLFNSDIMQNIGALFFLKLSHEAIWIDQEDMPNVIITRRIKH